MEKILASPDFILFITKKVIEYELLPSFVKLEFYGPSLRDQTATPAQGEPSPAAPNCTAL